MSNWPTYPQVYINGEFIGGLDIVKEMIANNEFNAPKDFDELEDRLKKLVNSAPVICFIKGTKSHPQCGFSKQIVQILESQNIQFVTFDILGDDDVRQGLKTFSDWPTFPQLYSKGNFIGGLDIVKELVELGEPII